MPIQTLSILDQILGHAFDPSAVMKSTAAFQIRRADAGRNTRSLLLADRKAFANIEDDMWPTQPTDILTHVYDPSPQGFDWLEGLRISERDYVHEWFEWRRNDSQ